MKPVSNWKNSWRWLSVQIGTLIAVLPPAWAQLPTDIKAMVPDGWEPWIVSGMAIALIVGRLIDQGMKE